jgi:type IV secretory pathway TraG/TraD family ATPase VirD4
LALIYTDFSAEDYNNRRLKRVLDSWDADELIDLIDGYANLKSRAQYIVGDNAQSQGVLSEMYSVINDILIGVFSDVGDFSIRDFVRCKGGRTLFVEYDMAIGETLCPIYTLLFDLALKETMGRNPVDSKEKGNVYLIMDEIKLLPHLARLEDGINFGRGFGLKILAGLQSIDQLNSVYKDNTAIAQNIISGFSSIISFRLNDAKTREHISKLHGKNIVLEEYERLDRKKDENTRNGWIVEDWDLARLEVGEAIVALSGNAPFKFYFNPYDKTIDT